MLLERLKSNDNQPSSVTAIVALIDRRETEPLVWHSKINKDMLNLCLAEILIDLFEFYGVDHKQAMRSIQLLLPRLVKTYYHLTPEDIRLFVDRACAGEYGKCYGQLTPSVLMEWLNTYSANRFCEIDAIGISEHNIIKEGRDNLTSERASDELNKMVSRTMKKFSVDAEYISVR